MFSARTNDQFKNIFHSKRTVIVVYLVYQKAVIYYVLHRVLLDTLMYYGELIGRDYGLYGNIIVLDQDDTLKPVEEEIFCCKAIETYAT